MKLQRLVYYSRNTMAEPEVAAEINQLLAASRRNNASADVTGALMFNAGCFAQVLEGPRDAVEQIFERIQRDPRHSAVVVLEYAPIEARVFPRWSMAFVGENPQGREAFGGIAEASGFDLSRVSAELMLQKLQGLLRDEEAAAA